MLSWHRSRRKFSARRLARRVVVSLLLLNWILLTAGVPLPVPVVKDRSQPFPCMDSQCGCNTAAACWRSCCCHTDLEKLVWARRHNITPPTYVVAAARREAARITQTPGSASPRKSCCQASHTSCCDEKESQASLLASLAKTLEPASPAKHSGSTPLPRFEPPANEQAALEPSRFESESEVGQPDEQPQAEETDFNTVTLASLLRCQGKSGMGLFHLEALPPSRAVGFQREDFTGEWVILRDQQPEQVFFSPPVPPPRLAL